jgi:GNAT superfamily N-acetyltransferase
MIFAAIPIDRANGVPSLDADPPDASSKVCPIRMPFSLDSPLRIECVSYQDGLSVVRDLRYRVLREPLGMPYETTLFAGDQLHSTRHVVGKLGQRPVGCLTLLIPERELHPAQASASALPVQLRGMAVLGELQGQGIGGQLLSFVQSLAEREGWELWCHARQSAMGFYAKHGWIVEGEPFEIPTIGTHFVMRWRPAASRGPG